MMRLSSFLLSLSLHQAFGAALLAFVLSACAHTKTGTVTLPEKAAQFSTPAEAAEALNQAAQSEDKKALIRVLGPQGAKLVDSGNPAADRKAIERFARRMTEKHSLEAQPNGEYVLYFGDDELVFPLPIAKDGDSWSFRFTPNVLNQQIDEDGAEDWGDEEIPFELPPFAVEV